MSIVNGGYAKVTKQLYAFEMRDSDNCAWVEFALDTSRRDAASRMPKDGRIALWWDETTMSPRLLEQARDWLRDPPRKSSIPSRSEPLLDRG